MRRICWILAAAAIFGVATGDIAQADPTYSYLYVAGQSAYTAAPDSDVIVPIYLQETSTDGSSLLANEDGLFAAGVSVNLTNAPSNPAKLTGLIGNADFASSDVSPVMATSASLLENTGSDPDGVPAASVSTNVSDVFLGTLTVHTGLLPGQTTTFAVGPFASDSGNTFTFDNSYDLDNNADLGNPEGSESLYTSAQATPFTITTTGAAAAVPEPSSLVALCGLGAMGLFIAARRRRSV